MPSLQQAYKAIAGLLAAHAIALVLGLYDKTTWFDIPMHFLGGFAIAVLMMAVWGSMVEKIVYRQPMTAGGRTVALAIIILGFVVLIGVGWEWYEFTLDQIRVALGAGGEQRQPGLADTMADLFFDVLGALIAFAVYRQRD